MRKLWLIGALCCCCHRFTCEGQAGVAVELWPAVGRTQY